ncbi:MAG TPA: hypothetical protein VFI31_20300 [Pirellulales bacterium]|nr:hypothetical protein [Pirellulales bacterium]
MGSSPTSGTSQVQTILDHPAISGRYLFPQPRCVDDPFVAQVTGAELACYRRVVDPTGFTLVHFHGNGEAVADYAQLHNRLRPARIGP